MAGRIERAVAPVRATLIVLLAGAGLAACATSGGNLSPSVARNDDIAGRGAGQGRGAHGTDAPYQVGGRWYYPHAQADYDEVGVASWYGAQFHNRRTADGEIFDQYASSAAHKTLPLPSIVEVTNLANGQSIRVRLNDRGPFADGRIIDLSRAAAAELGFEREGVARVRVRYIGPAPPLAVSGVMIASAAHPMTAPPRPIEAQPAPITPPQAEPGELASNGPPPILAAPPPADEPTAAPVDDEASAPAPIRSTLAAPSSPSVFAGYRVQAGAFQNRDNAERAAAQLAQAGTTSVQAVQRNGVTLYRVVVGGFSDPETAAGALVQVLDAGFTGARVTGAD